MKRNKNERPGFLSQMMAIVTGMQKRASHNEKEDSVQNSAGSEDPPIALPGSKWLLGCSAAAEAEITTGYEEDHSYETPANER